MTDSPSAPKITEVNHFTHAGYRTDALPVTDGLLSFLPSPLNPAESAGLYRQLLEEIAWQEDFIEVYGRRFSIPRLQAWYADAGMEYRYSDNLLKNQPWTLTLKRLCGLIEKATGCYFNSVLATYYRNGEDYVSWHADDEPELGTSPWIASLSLGVTRHFQYRHKQDKQVVQCSLQHGDLLLMTPVFQRFWQHQVPRQPEVQAGRINLTYRLVKRLDVNSVKGMVSR